MRKAFPLALTLLISLSAVAQPVDEPRRGRMYLSSSLLIGSTQLIGLGGAFVGIAEGSSAFPSNLAAIAHRSPELEEAWDLDVGLSYLDLPIGNPEALDLDNDGRPDDARFSRQLLFALSLQFNGFGVGGYSRTSVLRYCLLEPCGPDGDVRVTLATTSIAAAMALGDDELIVAVGLYSTTGEVDRAGAAWSYGAFGVTFDGLYRPVDRNFRVGVSVKPQIIGELRGGATPSGGLRPFEALVSPLTLSVGGSLRLGPGSERYNRLAPVKLRELGLLGPGERRPDPGPAGRWLLTAQLDVIAPVDEAVPIRALVDAAAPEIIGRRTGLVPRLGLEHETFPGRLRTRLGTFLEPSPFAERLARPHLTGGFQLFLFRYLEDWALSFSFDFAARYSDLGISIGLWR